jgi:purine-binding chemotaxis protein CheW
VQEIIRYQDVTPIPLATREVAGLINLRGDIVPTLDLRACFGAPPRAEGAESTNVVVLAPEGPVSFLVDAIGDIVDVDGGAFEPPPDNLRGPARDMLRGVYKLRDELLVELDADVVIAAATAPLART